MSTRILGTGKCKIRVKWEETTKKDEVIKVATSNNKAQPIKTTINSKSGDDNLLDATTPTGPTNKVSKTPTVLGINREEDSKIQTRRGGTA